VPVVARALRHSLPGFVDLKPRHLEVLDHPLCELLAGGIGDVLFQESAQEVAVLADHEADGKQELISERVLVHQRRVLMMFS
jgi:hypothetical protein